MNTEETRKKLIESYIQSLRAKIRHWMIDDEAINDSLWILDQLEEELNHNQSIQ